MTDHLDDFFADYRAGLTPEIVPAGPAAVRTTVRRRRRVAVTAVVATAIVLVAAPVAGYAAFNGAGPAPAPGTSSTPTPEQTTATPTPSPSAPTTTPPPPNGRISRGELLAAAVDLPPWQSNAPSSCTRDNVRLAGESSFSKPWLMNLVYGDVDADSAQETIATVGCAPGEADMQQVVVFDRDQAGKIVTRAQVVRTEQGVLGWIIKVTPAGKGTVKVRVGDLQPCCDMSEKQVQKQDRTYSWDGTGFAQSSGPTSFPERPDFRTDLKITASDLVFTNDKDGNPHGLITLTVRNAGPRDTINMSLSLDLSGLQVGREGPGWDACEIVQPGPNERNASPNCVLKDPLEAGETRTFRFHVYTTSVPTGLTGTVDVTAFDAGVMGDLNQEDNQATFKIR
ncbi:hypothetical protein ACTMTJ_00900 [Phytohabitans sp. LJ34]|uniref:hypothetical protein n=1 Tax=Phytohabitans sp. LJ34 TaxID=3452217 RepID=UPI003F8B1A4B